MTYRVLINKAVRFRTGYRHKVRFDFFCGDEVYGSCTELREPVRRHRHGRVATSTGHSRPLMKQVASAISGVAGSSQDAKMRTGATAVVHRTQGRVSAISACSSVLVRSRQ